MKAGFQTLGILRSMAALSAEQALCIKRINTCESLHRLNQLRANNRYSRLNQETRRNSRPAKVTTDFR